MAVAAAIGTPGATSAQEDDWKTDFTRHTVPLDEIVSGGPPKDGIPAIDDPRFVNDEVADVPIVVFWAPGTASALDRGLISEGRDVGASGVFRRTVEERTLDFEAVGDARFRDRQTESTWDLTGLAVDGPLSGTRLEPVPHGDYLWFAWAAFRPDTDVRR